MSHRTLDPDRCRDLWAAVFWRALQDAQTYIPSQPNHYLHSLYVQQRRKQCSKITLYGKWARERRSKIRKLELQRDEALAWMGSEDFGVCCELVGVNVEALRVRLLEMVAATKCNA